MPEISQKERGKKVSRVLLPGVQAFIASATAEEKTRIRKETLEKARQTLAFEGLSLGLSSLSSSFTAITINQTGKRGKRRTPQQSSKPEPAVGAPPRKLPLTQNEVDAEPPVVGNLPRVQPRTNSQQNTIKNRSFGEARLPQQTWRARRSEENYRIGRLKPFELHPQNKSTWFANYASLPQQSILERDVKRMKQEHTESLEEEARQKDLELRIMRTGNLIDEERLKRHNQNQVAIQYPVQSLRQPAGKLLANCLSIPENMEAFWNMPPDIQSRFITLVYLIEQIGNNPG